MITKTRFVTDGWADGQRDGAIFIYLPKFLPGHKNCQNKASVGDFNTEVGKWSGCQYKI